MLDDISNRKRLFPSLLRGNAAANGQEVEGAVFTYAKFVELARSELLPLSRDRSCFYGRYTAL